MTITELIDQIRATPECKLLPPSTLPSIRATHLLPDDVKEFYQLCGGATLFDNSWYSINIVQPEEVVLANPAIFFDVLPEPTEIKANEKEHVSWSWYIIAKRDSNECIVIDLEQTRLGRCYYSWWETHAMEKYSPIVAMSFTELLSQLLLNGGQAWYWEQADFESLGDAYEQLIDVY